LPAKDYIQDGLIAMWDGIENAGWGKHDPGATVWKDLVGTRDWTLTEFGSFSSCAFVNARNGVGATAQLIPTAEIPKVYQLETLMGQAGYNHYECLPFVYLGTIDTYMGVCFGKRYEGLIDSWPHYYHSWNTNGTATMRGYSSMGARERQVFVNGEEVSSKFITNNIGVIPETAVLRAGYYANTIHNIRLYNRALTAEEIAYNYNIDKQRFGL
jgi:hypothetical protein